MTYTIRQLAGIDPLFVADGEPVYLDTPRDPAPGPRRYGSRRPPGVDVDYSGTDRLIRQHDAAAGLFDPFTDEEAASVTAPDPAFDPDYPFPF